MKCSIVRLSRENTYGDAGFGSKDDALDRYVQNTGKKCGIDGD